MGDEWRQAPAAEGERGAGIEIACFDKRHAFMTARAAAEAQLLHTFHSAVAIQPRRLPYRVLLPLLRGRLAPARHRLLQQELGGVDDNLVQSDAWLGLPLKGVTGLPAVTGTRLSDSLNILASIYFDRRVARRLQRDTEIFHGFARYSAESIAVAKARGITTLLDQPEPHVDFMTKQEERATASDERTSRAFTWLSDIDIGRRRREVGAADYILVGLNFVRRNLIENGYPGDRVFVVPYGVEIPDGRKMREAGGSEHFHLLFVGALSWVKGLHLFLDALQGISIPNLRITVIGRAHGSLGDQLARRIRADHRIRWIPGVPQSELFNHYRAADALVFPSLVGGVGLVVYEAMSVGVPVIVSDGDVVIRDGVDGLEAPVDVPGSLERAIVALWQDHALRRRLGSAARARVTQFTWESYREGVRSVYEEISARRTR